VIEVAGLTRKFFDRTVVSDVTFHVGDGEILGFLGPNGAGKTTTMRMITGFLPPTAGSVRIGGLDLAERPNEVKRLIGYLPETVAPYPEMRVVEYLRFRADLEGYPAGRFRSRLHGILDRCLLDEVATQIVGNLSKGYRQRLGLASALIHEPSVLVLDEPTVGLDPKQIVKIRELIRELGRDHTILLSTHILPEVELVCDRVVIIDGGRIVASGPTETLRAQLAGNPTVRVEVEGVPPESVAERLGTLPGVRGARPASDGNGKVVVEGEPGSDPRSEIFRAVVESGWVLLEMTPERMSLEDVFVRITTREPTPPPADEPVPSVAERGESQA
jgi:ABC-2 type transport system ATP-binding protein